MARRPQKAKGLQKEFLHDLVIDLILDTETLTSGRRRIQ